MPLKFLADAGGDTAAFSLPNRHLVIKPNISTSCTLFLTTYTTTVERVNSFRFLGPHPKGAHQDTQNLPGQDRSADPLQCIYIYIH